MPLNYPLALIAIMFGHGDPRDREAIRSIALTRELLDPRECRFVLRDDHTDEAFAYDLKLLHERYKKLNDAPPACDADRFPSRDVITDLLAFNRAHRRFLEERKALFHEDWIDAAIAESNAAYAVYECVRDVKCDYYYVTAKREALAKLRDLLGPYNYYAGLLPAPVPVHRFRRTD